jgi:hypothetical protein
VPKPANLESDTFNKAKSLNLSVAITSALYFMVKSPLTPCICIDFAPSIT